MGSAGISWGELGAMLGVVVLVGQITFFVGRLWQRGNGHEKELGRVDRDLQTIFGKIEDIWQYIRNGHRPPGR